MGKRVRRTSARARFIASGIVLFLSFSFPTYLFPSSIVSPVRLPDSALISTATREGRLAVFDDAWARINERYYDQNFHGLNWDAQRTTFRALAAKTTSSEELYAVMRHMIAALNDPHTRIFAPEEKSDWWRPRFVSVGFALAEISGVPTVIKVDRDAAAQRAGLRVGDVLKSVNGEPALSLVKSRLSSLSDTASASERFRVFAKLLDGPAGTSVDVVWERKDGKQESARFERYWQQRELGVRVHRERSGYAVIEIEAFTKSIAVDFARELRQKLKNADGLILDLRMNGGGDAEAMTDIASTFLSVGTNLGQFTDRAGTGFALSTHLRSLLTADRLSPTKLPMIVLTSERTASAAEIFVAALRTSRRATIIGTETCGCVLAVRSRHLLPDGGLLDVSEMDYETAEGHRLEGNGLKPDETVTVERSDLYSGRDRALEFAVDELGRLRTTNP